jgi:hypothetical protein
MISISEVEAVPYIVVVIKEVFAVVIDYSLVLLSLESAAAARSTFGFLIQSEADRLRRVASIGKSCLDSKAQDRSLVADCSSRSIVADLL